MISYRSQKFLESLVSDPGTYSGIDKNPEKQKLKERIWAHLRKGDLQVIGGVFGEWKGCDGYMEELIKPAEGGTFMKIYGCSYLFKGYPDEKIVHGLEFPKWLLSEFPRDVVAKSLVLSGALGFLFLFARNKLIRYLDLIFTALVHRLRWYEIPDIEYSSPVKEIKRAILASLKENHNRWTVLIAKAAHLVCFILEMDTAYRFRVQDAFGAKKGLFEVLDTLISRETASGVATKWKFIRLALRAAFFFDSGLKAIALSFVANLDTEKVKMDDADWYFSLRYKSYNFGGKDEKWRFAERDRIDQEKGHIFLI